MAVAFDAVANLGQSTSPTGVSGFLTLGSSATILLVAVGGAGTTAYSNTTVTLVGTPNVTLPLLAHEEASGSWMGLYGLLVPPTGAQQIKIVSSASFPFLNATAISFSGVGQYGNAVVNGGTGTTPSSGAIVSASGNRVISAQGALNATITSPSGTQRSNQPSPANSSYVTLLIEDAAGASSVTLTSTLSSSLSWSAISLNLIAGTPHAIGASLAVTVTPSAPLSVFSGINHNIGGSLSLTATASANGAGAHLGPPLRYVGRAPDTDSVLVPASYAGPGTNSDFANTVVTSAWLTQQITNASQFLVTPAWIQGQINGTGASPVYPSQTSITTALGSYIPTTKLGQANGIAQLNGSAQIPTTQLPTLTTNSVAKGYDCFNNGTVFLAPGAFYETTTNNIGEFVLANVVVPDPGYPWIPLVFVYVVGYSAGGTIPTGSRLIGTGNYGLLTVTIDNGKAIPETNPVYAAGLCTDSPLPNFYSVVPGCLSVGSITPLTQPPLIGGATLDLAGCNWQGSGYTYGGSGLVFSVLVVPGLS